MAELAGSDPELFLNGAVDCHLRVSTLAQKSKTKCRLCTVHDNIEIYENALFHFIKGEIKGRCDFGKRSSFLFKNGNTCWRRRPISDLSVA